MILWSRGSVPTALKFNWNRVRYRGPTFSVCSEIIAWTSLSDLHEWYQSLRVSWVFCRPSRCCHVLQLKDLCTSTEIIPTLSRCLTCRIGLVGGIAMSTREINLPPVVCTALKILSRSEHDNHILTFWLRDDRTCMVYTVLPTKHFQRMEFG